MAKGRKVSSANLKTHYSAQELADLKLPGVPSTRPGVTAKAKREGWLGQPRKERGGGIEYHIDCLPEQAREIVKRRFLNQAVASAENC
ncbi:transposase, partial [Salmonella enterica subsp. enterica serovar Oranienburg]|nr:transposase [Salmonella enterica subsp. enterica serovar Oranienburg]